MIKRYWARVGWEAFRRAWAGVMGTVPKVLLSLAGAGAVIWGLWDYGSGDAAKDEVIAILAFAGTCLVVFLSQYFYWLVRVPAEIDSEQSQRLQHLERLAPLADRLDETSHEIIDFARDFEYKRPAPNDSLNYISPGFKGRAKISGSGNMITGDGDDPLEIRMIRNLQDERRNHEIQSISEFYKKFAGKILNRLAEAQDMGAISEDDCKSAELWLAMNSMGNSATIFRKIASLCAGAATAIRESPDRNSETRA